jgi:excinuclease UvrABC helicase subunit UvrB
MNTLSGLIDRLQELASSAPAEHRTQLSRQVVALRAMSKKQQGHFMEFLQLSEEYANRYLLDISAEIQQQSSFLEKLEGRLETAKKLRQDAIDLQMLYESGTVATMENLRATGKASCCLQSRNIETLILALPRPFPEDHALFNEVDSVLAEIRRCYMEMDKFWTEEISRAIEALKMRRVGPTDLERWENFHANLKHAIESWKVQYRSYS